MQYTLALVLLIGERNPRVLLLPADGSDLRLELIKRFGFGRFKLSAHMELLDMPPVGDPAMDALCELFNKDIKQSGSTGNLLTQLTGDAVIFGYMIAKCEFSGNPPDSDEAPDIPDDDPSDSTK
ncbi:MAG: hypothetical protein AAB965_00025 [Patescibacteria group bacterium]|mgnify:CR=1 FL=1